MRYSLLDVKEENLEDTINKVRKKELQGINVTLPYKQKVLPFIDRLVNDAKNTNSVNTIFLDESNNIVGENTTTYMVYKVAYLKKVLKGETKKALIIGAVEYPRR